jgi:hypothetical protein
MRAFLDQPGNTRIAFHEAVDVQRIQEEQAVRLELVVLTSNLRGELSNLPR